MSGTFAQAITRHDAPAEPIVVDPRSGEVLNLQAEAHTLLIDALIELRRREDQLKRWRVAVEDELVRRHGDRKHAVTVGDYEIDLDRKWRRVWDATDLITVVEDLQARGLVHADDIAGLTRWEQKVDGRKALALLNRSTEDAHYELSRCFRWEQGSRPSVQITDVVSLEAPR